MSESTGADKRRERDQVGFPLRVGCIDAGSNALRFMVAEFTDARSHNALRSHRAPVRLGHGVFLTGRLSSAGMDEAVQAFREFKEAFDELEVTRYRAVATSAVRESSNGPQFIDRIKSETGIDLEVINGSEEARLGHLAIRNRVRLGRQPWLVADLGGGSVEVSLVDDSGILWSESHTMGSVRLLEELAESDDDPGRFRRVLSDYVSTLRIPTAAQPVGFIATGGNIEAIARLVGAGPDEDGVSLITTDELRGVIDRLAVLSYRDRVDELGLREDRADVILPAALVYEQVADLAGTTRIRVPHVGIKDGVLLDLVDDLTGHRDHEQRLERQVYDAGINLGRRYFFDEAHAVQTAELARSLFDQLQPVHELDFGDRSLLLAAALLHDVGSYISRKKHHRHSQYIISHSELGGLSPRKIQLVATVARFHRKREPFPEHEAMQPLTDAEQHRVTALTGLLRLADGLDREHRQAVRGVTVKLKKGAVILQLDTENDLLLGRFTLRKRAELFANTFDVEIKLRTARGAAVRS